MRHKSNHSPCIWRALVFPVNEVILRIYCVEDESAEVPAHVLSYLFGFATEETSISTDIPIAPTEGTDPIAVGVGGGPTNEDINRTSVDKRLT